MRTRTIVLAAVAVVALAAAAGVAAAQDGTADEADAEVELSFGEQVSVLVHNHQTEVSHTVENEAFEVAFERDGEEAVEERARQLGERMDRAEQRKAEIDERLEAGEISERRAKAEKAKLANEGNAVNRSSDRVLERAAEQGINASAVETLKQRASELSGPEVSEIARSIAGPGVADDRRPGDTGPPEDRAGADARPGEAGEQDDEPEEVEEEPEADEAPEGDDGAGGDDGAPADGAGY